MVKVFSRDRGPFVTVPVEKTTAKSTTSSNIKMFIVVKKKTVISVFYRYLF